MKLITLTTLLFGVMTISVRADNAPNPSAIVRDVLQRHDQSGDSHEEIVMGKVIIPAGGSIDFHTHPGDEAGYVVSGSLLLKTKGQPDKTLAAGDSFVNPRGSVHSVEAGVGGATIVSTWIVDKGAPLATPVR